jgi:hypothetical protein
MQQIKCATFPSFLDDLDAIQDEINAAIKRTWLMLGGIVLPCAALVVFALISAGK